MSRRLDQLVGAQLRLPHGLGAPIVASYMDRLNARMIEETIGLLAPADEHGPVLDIGFGGGRSLALLLADGARGTVCGVEPSSTMLLRARARFLRHVAAGRLVLRRGRADSLPFEGRSFGTVISINTIYFWPDLTQGLSEIARVLDACGRVALGFRPRHVMAPLPFTKEGFTLYEPEEVIAALTANGLAVRRLVEAQDAHLRFTCLVAQRAGAAR